MPFFILSTAQEVSQDGGRQPNLFIALTYVFMLTAQCTRWLFIINAIMTIFLGALGFFALPDSPHDPNPLAKWLSKDQAKLATDRLDRLGRAKPGKITWKTAK